MAASTHQAQLIQAVPDTFTQNALRAVLAQDQASVINDSGATRTLKARESGSIVLFNRAAGIVYTLPAPQIGLNFTFIYETTITGGSGTVTTNAGTVFIGGSLIGIDTDTSNAVAAYTANGTSIVSIASNGTTTGGLAGSRFTLECVSATRWVCSGTMLGNGVVATPFA